jgi:hypothetical protein
MKLAMTQQTDPAVVSTICTVLLSAIGLQEIDELTKIIFASASTVSCIVTISLNYLKYKKLKDEKNTKKH